MSRQLLCLLGTGLLIAVPSVMSAEETQPPADPPQGRTTTPPYTCPTHPAIQWSRPDKCPICDMKLVAKRATAPSPADEMHDHAGMSISGEGMHGHGGMGSKMMGGGCSMCMEMMGMGGMNGHGSKASAAKSRPTRPMYRSSSSGGYSRGCGC